MSKRVAIATISCLITMATIALLYFIRSSEADPSSHSRGDEPVEAHSAPPIVDPRSIEDLSVQRVGAEQAAISVRLSDPIIGTALRYSRLWAIADDTGTQEAPIVETNYDGIALVTEKALAELRSTLGARRRARVTFDSRNPYVECRVVHVGNESKGRPIDVEVVAHSGLRVFLSRESGNLRDAKLWVYALPAIPDAIVDSNQRLTLETLRISDPQRYLNELEALVEAPPERLTLFRGVQDSSAPFVEFHLPYEGDVLVSAGDVQASGVSQIVKVSLGGIVDTHIRLVEKPTISGRVLMETGGPVVGVRVTVCVKTASDPGEDFPRTTEEDGSPGMIIITGENPSYPKQRTIYQQLSTVSGDGGYYRIAMPYSDTVAAWVFDPAFGKGLSDRRTGSRESHVEGLDIVLIPPQFGSQVSVFDPDDNRLKDTELLVAVVDAQNPYQVKLPPIRTDEAGTFDSWMLDDGKSYVVFASDANLVPQRFVFNSERRLRFERRW